MDWEAIRLSGVLAFWTTLILFFLALPLAYWLAFSENRFKSVFETVLALPLVLPPTVLGFYILSFIGPSGWIGKLYTNSTGELLPFSFLGLLIGSVLYSLPFAVQPMLQAFSTLDKSWMESSWCLGASRWRTFVQLIFPLSKPGIFTGLILSFAHTLGEFGIVLMLGGNIQGKTRTASISIYDDVQALDYASAGRTSLLLVLVAFSVLTLTALLKRRSLKPWQKS